MTSDETTITFVETMHAAVDENGSITLTAPTGLRFAQVLFASYGTPEGLPGSAGGAGGGPGANAGQLGANTCS